MCNGKIKAVLKYKDFESLVYVTLRVTAVLNDVLIAIIRMLFTSPGTRKYFAAQRCYKDLRARLRIFTVYHRIMQLEMIAFIFRHTLARENIEKV